MHGRKALLASGLMAIMIQAGGGGEGPLGPDARAGTWQTGGVNDPSQFNASWHPTRYEYRFDALPLRGSVANEQLPWGDSYWPLQRGGLAHRWLDFREDSLDLARDGYARKNRYFGLRRYLISELLAMPKHQRRDRVRTLSPLEKYSLYLGDDSYALIDRFSKTSDAFLSSWQGYCHAWAPVALHYSEPSPVSRVSRDGIEIDFGSSDVKALMIASYAERVKASWTRFWNGFSRRAGNVIRRARGAAPESPDAVFIGGRCSKRFIYPDTRFRNGREEFAEYGEPSGVMDSEYPQRLREFQRKALELGYRPEEGPAPSDPDFIKVALQNRDEPSCSDVNAGAFHVVLTNQLGHMKEGFLIDKARDLEVWNQPVFRFESTVLGERGLLSRSSSRVYRELRIRTRIYFADDTDHGWAWWFPTLTALFGPAPGFEEEYRRYQDSLLRNGDAETRPVYPEGVVGTSDYEYTLELDRQGRVIGGAWISFERPDFMWLFRKSDFTGAFQRLREIYEPESFPEEERPIIFSEPEAR
jgi:hypothetical protein